jgi:type I restriction enzyme S subunit
MKRLSFGSAQPQLTVKGISTLKIPLPPTKAEQEAIAKVLGGADALNKTLGRLIAEKTEFKRGLMQQLLTGRKRFKEFEGQEWKQYHLGDVAIESELRNNGRLTEKSLYAVTKAYGMIPMRERVQGESVERCKVVSKDWFAYNPMRLNIGSIAKWNNKEDVLVSPDYVVFRCDETLLDPDFLNHYRRSHRWAKFVEKAGDGSVRVRIWFSHLAELKLSLPSLPEQRRIAAVLNACDRELDLLREQLAEFKKQKQGLMQKLLTGQIRVKVEEAQVIGV